MNENVTSAQSRKRPLIAVVAGVLLISLVLLALFAMFSSSRLNQRIADLRSRGLPTDAAELNIVTIATYRYRLQHGGLPKSLRDLNDLIPGDVSDKSSRLIDPFDGQSLRFKSDNGRVLIYSIGYNNVDDGGDIATEQPQPSDLGYSVAE